MTSGERRFHRVLGFLAGCVGVVVLAHVAVGLYGGKFMRVNLWNSVPVGVYWVSPITTIERGMFVTLAHEDVFPQEWAERVYVPRGIWMTKPVAGMPGDEVCISDTVTINGEIKALDVATEDEQGRPLVPLQGCFQVPDGEVFLLAPGPHSLDSRYFGAVPIATLREHARLLWRW